MPRVKTSDKKWIIAVSVMMLLGIISLSVVIAEEEDWKTELRRITCCGRYIAVRVLQNPEEADYSQDAEDQQLAWETFMELHDGLEEDDKSTEWYRTKTYNCHSFTFGPGDGKLWSFNPYIGDGSGCWSSTMCGTVKAESSHSCFTADYEGKCGAQFCCKNNQYVYEDVEVFMGYDQIE